MPKILFILILILFHDCNSHSLKSDNNVQKSKKENSAIKNKSFKLQKTSSSKSQNTTVDLGDAIDLEIRKYAAQFSHKITGISADQHDITHHNKYPNLSCYNTNEYNVSPRKNDGKKHSNPFNNKNRKSLNTNELTDEEESIYESFSSKSCSERSIGGKSIDYAVINIIDPKKQFEFQNVYVYIPTTIATSIISFKRNPKPESKWYTMKFKNKILILPNGPGKHWETFILHTKSKIAVFYDGTCSTGKQDLSCAKEKLKNLLYILELRNRRCPDDIVDTKDWTVLPTTSIPPREPKTENYSALRCILFIDSTINEPSIFYNGSVENYRKEMQSAVLSHIKQIRKSSNKSR